MNKKLLYEQAGREYAFNATELAGQLMMIHRHVGNPDQAAVPVTAARRSGPPGNEAV